MCNASSKQSRTFSITQQIGHDDKTRNRYRTNAQTTWKFARVADSFAV